MKTADSHMAAARYYFATGMVKTAKRELKRATAARQKEAESMAFRPSKRDAIAMRAALAAFRKF